MIVDSVIRGNSTSGDNAQGGGVFSRTDITLIDSIVTNNSTSGERSYGGGVAAEGLLTITGGEVYGNLTIGRFSDGGGAFSEGGAVVSRSNISDNLVRGNFAADGGGLATRGALTLTNSTVAYNRVDSYRGYGGGIRVEGDATISHSTIVGNSVDQEIVFTRRNEGASITFEADLTVNNSIIVGNVSQNADEPELGAYLPYQDYALTFTGLNIVGASAGRFDASALSNVINADPSVVFEGGEYGFALHGASVRTIALSADPENPALDAAMGDDVEDFDARGVPGAGARDLGAYELITDASLVVTTGDDVLDATDGVLSLREAVYFANEAEGANTITFAPEIEGVIRLTEGEVLIFDDLTVDGGGRITITGDAEGNDRPDANGNTDIAASSEAGVLGDNSRIFYSVGQTETLTIDGLTLTGGFSDNDKSGGGAIRSNGDVVILNSVITGNGTAGQNSKGGGVYARQGGEITDSAISGNATLGSNSGGGGIYAFDRLTITGSTISDNKTSGDGSDGGGVFGYRGFDVTETTISGNSTSGSGASGGGAITFQTSTFTNSVIYGNSVSGPSASGGGLLSGSELTLTSTTISGNIARGPLSSGGGLFVRETADLISSTISGNFTNGFGGGVSIRKGEDLTLTDSIVLGNYGSQSGDDISSERVSSVAPAGFIDLTGVNIVGKPGDTLDTAVGGSGAIIQADAATVFAAITENPDNDGEIFLSGVLADNGGPVQTIALRAAPTNPALDAANSAIPDARGLARTDLGFVDNGGAADLGAFELQTADLSPPSFTSPAAQTASENQTSAGIVSATDDLPGVTFAITGGADASRFTIGQTTGALSFLAPPNFEAPGDGNRDNRFEVRVTATDATGQSVDQALTIQVTNVNEAPVAVAATATGFAGEALSGALGAADIDGDALTFALVDPALNGAVTINPNGQFSFLTDASFVGADSFTYSVSDGVLSDTARVTLSVTEAPAAPTDGDDALSGTAGNDTINALAGEDTVSGLAGDDLLTGASGDDSLLGGGGEDVIRGSGGDDTVKGGAGADSLFGNGGEDLVLGNGGADTLRAGGGTDEARGGGGADLIFGGGGADVIRGNGGADTLRGNGGADDVNGGGGADLIFGGGGADRLSGAGGADTLRGDGGNDTLFGGGGADVFQFRAADRRETILDFRQGQDRIEIQTGANAFADLDIQQSGADVLIGFGATEIRVVTDNAGAFSSVDFIF